MSIRVVLCAIVVADLFCAYLSSCVGFMKVPVSFALNRVSIYEANKNLTGRAVF